MVRSGLSALCATVIGVLAFAVTTTVIAQAQAPIRQGSVVRLSTPEWRCIASRLNRFAQSTSSRIIIPVVACPVVQNPESSASQDTTELSLDFRATAGSDKRAYRGLLTVTREELECLLVLRDREAIARAAPAKSASPKTASAKSAPAKSATSAPPATNGAGADTVTLDLASPVCGAANAQD